jgi:hypothetical protein
MLPAASHDTYRAFQVPHLRMPRPPDGIKARSPFTAWRLARFESRQGAHHSGARCSSVPGDVLAVATVGEATCLPVVCESKPVSDQRRDEPFPVCHILPERLPVGG